MKLAKYYCSFEIIFSNFGVKRNVKRNPFEVFRFSSSLLYRLTIHIGKIKFV